jgi:site-specific DNA-methyltransferase (adenine-specific)
MLYLGDCLTTLPEVASQPGDRFDLIYVDPPFNAGGVRAARQGQGERARGTKAYQDSWGGLDRFISMLGPRLEVMRDALTASGSLWLHLDHRTVHDAKVLADSVFGRRAFRGEVIWVPGNGGRRKSGVSVTHQTILVYAPSSDFIYSIEHPALREPYAETSQRMHFNQTDAKGRRFRRRVIGGKEYRYYADRGRRLGSVWSDCPAMRANTPLTSETTGYPTQKPESLLERIVVACSHEESRVLDPMCGSGTTVAVAARLGRRWVGIDQSKVAFETTKKRLGL